MGTCLPVHGRHSPWLGFNYNFGALDVDGKPNELNEAFATMLGAGQRQSILPILQAWFPPLRLIVSTINILFRATSPRLSLCDSLPIVRAELGLRDA
jgi:hypothetical protein